MHIIIIDCIVQSSTAPPNDTAIPAASRRGNPVQQPAAEQCEENRADFDQHCGAARVDVKFAPVESYHIQPEPEQPRAQNSGQVARVGQPSPLSSHTTTRLSGVANRRPQRERTRREMPARATDRDEGRIP